jgi:hypothetical protein
MTSKPGIKGERRWKRARRRIEIPVNVERVLLRASGDPEFRARLLGNRRASLEDERLTPSERGMLEAMPASTLELMVEGLAPVGRSPSRFARQVAAAVAGSMIISVAACEQTTRGAEPDLDTSTEDVADTADVEDSSSDSMSWGARPDLPDE